MKVLVLAALAGIAACGTSNKAPQATAISRERAYAVEVTHPGEGSPVALGTIDVGQGKVGRVLVFEVTSHASIDGNPVPALKLPETRVPLRARLEAGQHGEVLARVKIGRHRIEPEPGQSAAVLNLIKVSFGALSRQPAMLTVHPFGDVHAIDLGLPDGAEERVRDVGETFSTFLRLITLPRPGSAVGVGGVWTVALPVRNGPATEVYALEYRVEAERDDGVDLAISGTLSGPVSTEDAAADAPDAATRTLVEAHGTISGSAHLPAGALWPDRLRLEVAATRRYDVRSGPIGERLEVKMTTRLLLEPAT